MTVRKLKRDEIATTRAAMLAQQDNHCLLCKRFIAPKDAVLDHCHTTGHIRGVLHRGCNSILGKCENNYRRFGMTLPQLHTMLSEVGWYMNRDYSRNPLHNTYKTEEDKRQRRNMLARRRRAAKKD